MRCGHGQATGAVITMDKEVLPHSNERPCVIAGTTAAVAQSVFHIACTMIQVPAKGVSIPYMPGAGLGGQFGGGPPPHGGGVGRYQPGAAPYQGGGGRGGGNGHPPHHHHQGPPGYGFMPAGPYGAPGGNKGGPGGPGGPPGLYGGHAPAPVHAFGSGGARPGGVGGGVTQQVCVGGWMRLTAGVC